MSGQEIIQIRTSNINHRGQTTYYRKSPLCPDIPGIQLGKEPHQSNNRKSGILVFRVSISCY